MDKKQLLEFLRDFSKLPTKVFIKQYGKVFTLLQIDSKGNTSETELPLDTTTDTNFHIPFKYTK